MRSASALPASVTGPAGLAARRTALPEGWRTARLDALADLVSGGTPSKSRPEWWAGPVPWASPKDMKRLRLADTIDHISEEAAKAGSRVVPAKTIFVVIRGMILAKALPVAMAEVPMAFNQDMKAVIPRPGIDPDYLLYALASQRDALAREIGTSAHGTRRLGSSSLQALPIPMPPLNEQRAIGYFLSKLQHVVEVQSQIVRTVRRVKETATAGVFGEGVRAAPRQMTRFGPVPGNWQIEALENVAEVQTGVAKGRKFANEEMTEVPYLRVANVQDGRLELSHMKTIQIRRSEVDRYRLKVGDVVLTEGGDFDKLGRGFIWRAELELCVHQNHVFAVRPDRRRLTPEFFAYLTQAPYGKSYFRTVAHKTTNLACINTAKLKAFPVPVPPLDEQQQIVATLDAIDRNIALHERRRAVLHALFESLLTRLTSGEIRFSPRMIATLSLRARETVPKPHGKVDDRIVQEAVRRIVEAVAPEKIILFGSAARGEMTRDSDLDFLVVKGGVSRRETQRRIREQLRGIGVPVDVIVVTPEDVERDRDTIGLIIRPALREGRVVYAA